MGFIVFTWGPFVIALGARPIPILYPILILCLDKVKSKKKIKQNHRDRAARSYIVKIVKMIF